MDQVDKDHFKNISKIALGDVETNILSLLSNATSNELITWYELVLIKRPNVVENITQYGFIKKNLRSGNIFKSHYDKNLVALTLMAFQSAYESMLRKTFTVLFEAIKKIFKGKAWYTQAFKDRESNYNTVEILNFISDCLAEDTQSSTEYLPLMEIVNFLKLKRLNKIRNAVAHNIYVIEGGSEVDSRICYSSSDSRCYFMKSDYQTMKTSDLLKILNILDIFHDFFLECLSKTINSNSCVVFCNNCSLQSISETNTILTKKCYFCGCVGKFSSKPMTSTTMFPKLP